MILSLCNIFRTRQIYLTWRQDSVQFTVQLDKEIFYAFAFLASYFNISVGICCLQFVLCSCKYPVCTLCSCRPVPCLCPSVCPDPDLSCLRHNRLQNISTIYNVSTINTISIYIISSSVCPFHSIYNSTYRVISSFSTQRYYRNTETQDKDLFFIISSCHTCEEWKDTSIDKRLYYLLISLLYLDLY